MTSSRVCLKIWIFLLKKNCIFPRWLMTSHASPLYKILNYSLIVVFYDFPIFYSSRFERGIIRLVLNMRRNNNGQWKSYMKLLEQRYMKHIVYLAFHWKPQFVSNFSHFITNMKRTIKLISKLLIDPGLYRMLPVRM